MQLFVNVDVVENHMKVSVRNDNMALFYIDVTVWMSIPLTESWLVFMLHF